MASITILSRIGVSYYDSSLRQLYVMEVWEDGGEDFPLIDMGMCSHIFFQEKVSISLGVSPIFCGINWFYMFSFFLYLFFFG